MHPSPNALVGMTTDDLMSYREELRMQAIETDETFNGPCRTRVELIDAILADRKHGPGADPVRRDQSKHVGADGRLRYSADGSEVFPGATGVRRGPRS